MYVLSLCISDLSTIIAIIQSLYFTHKRVMIYFDIDINLIYHLYWYSASHYNQIFCVYGC